MRLQITITELDRERWDYLQRQVRTEYQIKPGETRVCLTFTHEGEERHAEMPLAVLVGLLIGLGTVGMGQVIKTAMAALTPDALPDAVTQDQVVPDAVIQDQVVRNDCAFCRRERVFPKDDNHAPECSYWSIGPGSLLADEDIPEWLKDELDRRQSEFPDWKRP